MGLREKKPLRATVLGPFYGLKDRISYNSLFPTRESESQREVTEYSKSTQLMPGRTEPEPGALRPEPLAFLRNSHSHLCSFSVSQEQALRPSPESVIMFPVETIRIRSKVDLVGSQTSQLRANLGSATGVFELLCHPFKASIFSFVKWGSKLLSRSNKIK